MKGVLCLQKVGIDYQSVMEFVVDVVLTNLVIG
jgi:hypothetical protein